MPGPAEPELTTDQQRSLVRSVAEFNAGRYFECHETIEEVWLGIAGPSRDFFQALIQVSAGFHHLGRGSRVGALRTFGRALGRFEAYPDRYCGFDVAAERARLNAVLAVLAVEGTVEFGPPPVWRPSGYFWKA